MKKDLVLAVIGPTASGKTSLAIALAKEFGGEIICCDSMQIYKHMEIGTAGPTEDELAQAPHHLFNYVEPTVNYNAALYQQKARETIDEVLSRGRLPILCGGTGLYVKSALYDMNFTTASADEEYRTKLWEIYEKNGEDFLHDMLKDNDPESAESIHKNNVKRVIRALEIHHLSGVSKSEQKQEEKKLYKNSFIIGLNHDRNTLYERINKRVDMMVEAGLEEEVRALIKLGVTEQNNALKAIGYKEWLDCFKGDTTLEECIYSIKLNSRHYAKRQLTWFNRMDVEWFDYEKSIISEYTQIFKFVKK